MEQRPFLNRTGSSIESVDTQVSLTNSTAENPNHRRMFVTSVTALITSPDVVVRMAREIKFSDISTLLDEIAYPIERTTASEELSDVRLILADGDTNLGKLVSEVSHDSFESAADIESALHNVLPREAVGEPYQSEGDA